MTTIEVSTVTPVYSGEAYLRELVHELAELRERWQRTGSPLRLREALFVDDDAIDGSAKVLEELARQFDWIQVIHLSKNFGQHPATVAGILYTSGDWVVTLDEDLQHHPQLIDTLFKQVADSSCDIVYANPQSRVHENSLRDLGSRLYKRFLARLTGIQHIKDFNSFRLIRGSIARAAASVCGPDTYFDIALSWFASRIESVSLELKDQRFISGQASGYNLRKLLSHARRLVISAQTKWLRVAAALGIFAMLLSIVFGLYTTGQKLLDPESVQIRGWTSLFVSISFFGGLISFLLAVVLEYIAVMLLHSQGKPKFFVVDRSADAILADHYRN